MDKTNNQEEIVLGTNSALIPESIKNYVPKIYERKNFFEIPFKLDDLDLINGNAMWCPSEEDIKFIGQVAYDETLADYHKKKETLLFTNTFVNYESCDCGDGYGCSHKSWPCEIEVIDKINSKAHLITIDGNDSMIFEYGKTDISINGLINFTYGDFIRFCKLCDINLESKYVI